MKVSATHRGNQHAIDPPVDLRPGVTPDLDQKLGWFAFTGFHGNRLQGKGGGLPGLGLLPPPGQVVHVAGGTGQRSKVTGQRSDMSFIVYNFLFLSKKICSFLSEVNHFPKI